MEQAGEFVRSHGKDIVERCLLDYHAEEHPISIFMAGSPGAGKTETSNNMLKHLSNIVRIDADELRDCFRDCGYNGANSHLFQRAATNLVHRMHNAVLKHKLSFLLDGTFANEEIARANIQRSLKRGRKVFVIFVYQPPQTAWHFIQRREAVEGRRVRADIFAEKFCESQVVVSKIKAEFGNQINLTLIANDITNPSVGSFRENIKRLEDHIPKHYTAKEILALINNPPAVMENSAIPPTLTSSSDYASR